MDKTSTSRNNLQPLSITTGEKLDVARELGFDETGLEWYVYRIPYLTVRSAQKFEKAGLQYYLPTFKIEKPTKHGKPLVEERPKILNYLFVLAKKAQIDELAKQEKIFPLYRHLCKGEIVRADQRYTTVPKDQMHQLMIMVEGYKQEVEFRIPPSQQLAKGDKVRVVEGPFAGVEGILLTNQGAGGGQVYVSITNGMGALTATIADAQLQVLEFSRQNNHFYYKMQAVEQHILDAENTHAQGQALTAEQRLQLEFFRFRYAHLTGLSRTHQAKFDDLMHRLQQLIGRE